MTLSYLIPITWMSLRKLSSSRIANCLTSVVSRQTTSKIRPATNDPRQTKEYPLTLPRGTKKEMLVALKEVLQKYPGDATVVLLIPQNGGFERVPTKTSVKPSKDLDTE